MSRAKLSACMENAVTATSRDGPQSTRQGASRRSYSEHRRGTRSSLCAHTPAGECRRAVSQTRRGGRRECQVSDSHRRSLQYSTVLYRAAPPKSWSLYKERHCRLSRWSFTSSMRGRTRELSFTRICPLQYRVRKHVRDTGRQTVTLSDPRLTPPTDLRQSPELQSELHVSTPRRPWAM